jgi:hypothetical protein
MTNRMVNPYEIPKALQTGLDVSVLKVINIKSKNGNKISAARERKAITDDDLHIRSVPYVYFRTLSFPGCGLAFG